MVPPTDQCGLLEKWICEQIGDIYPITVMSYNLNRTQSLWVSNHFSIFSLEHKRIFRMLFYLDAGPLTYFSRNPQLLDPIRNSGFTIAYSESNLGDLKNARNQKRELDFLKNENAIYLEGCENGQLIGQYNSNPHELFENYTSINENILGQLLNRMVGGGLDIKDSEFLARILQDIPDFAEYGLDTLLFLGIGDENSASKNDLFNAFNQRETIPIGKALRGFLDEQPQQIREMLLTAFPSMIPQQTEKRAEVAILLNFLLPKPAKGIQSVDAAPSKREVLDSYHIAYALGCDLFFTTDKATAGKYKLLADYWQTKGKACVMTRPSS